MKLSLIHIFGVQRFEAVHIQYAAADARARQLVGGAYRLVNRVAAGDDGEVPALSLIHI